MSIQYTEQLYLVTMRLTYASFTAGKATDAAASLTAAAVSAPGTLTHVFASG